MIGNWFFAIQRKKKLQMNNNQISMKINIKVKTIFSFIQTYSMKINFFILFVLVHY